MASRWVIAAEAGLAARSLSRPHDNSDVSDNSSQVTRPERANVSNVTNVTPSGEKPRPLPHVQEGGQNAFSGDVSALADNSSADDIEREGITIEGFDWRALFAEEFELHLVRYGEYRAPVFAWGICLSRYRHLHGCDHAHAARALRELGIRPDTTDDPLPPSRS